jgi:hypothetical protein
MLRLLLIFWLKKCAEEQKQQDTESRILQLEKQVDLLVQSNNGITEKLRKMNEVISALQLEAINRKVFSK